MNRWMDRLAWCFVAAFAAVGIYALLVVAILPWFQGGP